MLLTFLVITLVRCAAVSSEDGRNLLANQRRAVSATTADLVNDPTGKGHLLARLGNPSDYQGDWMYKRYPADQFNIDPRVDPTPEVSTSDAKRNGKWRLAGNTGAVAVHAVPFENGLILFMQRPTYLNGSGYNPSLKVNDPVLGAQTELAALYNRSSNTFTPFHIAENPFCGAHTLLPDGRAVVVGGDMLQLNPPFLEVGYRTLRIFDPNTQQYRVVGEMERGRWYPSVMVMADGNLLILGGMQQEAGGFGADQAPSTTSHPRVLCSRNAGGSLADPAYDNPTFNIMNTTDFSQSRALALTILLNAWPVGSYPFLVQLPAGSVLVIAGNNMQALFFEPDGAREDMSIGDLLQLPVPVNYPPFASLALLDLEPPHYAAKVLIAGGTSELCSNAETPASETSYLIDVTPGANHSVIEEHTHFRRVMSDLVNLPDGRLFLCNGAKVGQAGGEGPGAGAAFNGTTTAEIYDPRRPIGQRWRPVADSRIWRLYHSVAFLTENAEVLVAGSEITARAPGTDIYTRLPAERQAAAAAHRSAIIFQLRLHLHCGVQRSTITRQSGVDSLGWSHPRQPFRSAAGSIRLPDDRRHHSGMHCSSKWQRCPARDLHAVWPCKWGP